MKNIEINRVLYPIADALEMDLSLHAVKGVITFQGHRKAPHFFFEGYSPIVVASIVESFVDELNEVAVAIVRIFGNLRVMVVCDTPKKVVSLYVFDATKCTEKFPLTDTWSRAKAYAWLEPSVRAIYSQSLIDLTWVKLPLGRVRLKKYNEERADKVHSSLAYNNMWGS